MRQLYDYLPDAVLLVFTFLGGVFYSPLMAAIVGRFVFHALRVDEKRRKWRDPILIADLAICFLAVLVASGLVSYFDMKPETLPAVSAVLAYLGPRGVEGHLEEFFKRRRRR